MTGPPSDDALSARYFNCRSGGLRPRQQYDLWSEFGSACDALPAPASPRNGFDFDIDAWHLGRGLMACWRQSPQRLLRSRSLIRADGRDQYVLLLGEDGGRAGDIEGKPIEVAPGALCLLDLSRPFDLVRNPSTSLCYLMPRGLLDEAVPPGDWHGVTLTGGIAGLLAEHLMALKRHVRHLTDKDFSRLNRATRCLLAAALDGCEDNVARAGPAASAALLMRAKRAVERRLGRHAISIDALCRDLSISRSQLYRLFAEFGGVVAYANKRRLAKVKAALEAGDRGTIADIAHRHGFADEAYFSRAFRRAYGLSPGGCRRLGEQATEVAPLVPPPGHRPWASWVESLEAQA